MYLTWTVYVLLIALLIWGGKFAGFKKENFHEDSASLDSFMSLRGFAAIGVILAGTGFSVGQQIWLKTWRTQHFCKCRLPLCCHLLFLLGLWPH